VPIQEPSVGKSGESEDHSHTRSLLEQGLYLQAWEASKAHGDIMAWRGCEAQILGGRLLAHLGAHRGAAILHLRAHRSNRNNAAAAYFRGARIFNTRGPFRVWKFLASLPDFPEARPSDQGDLLALRARALAVLRDFRRAEPLVDQAISLAPDRAWLWCEKAEILRAWDRNDEAMAHAEHALGLTPHYRPAVHLMAQLLQAANRDHDSLALLKAADEQLESGSITCQLAGLQMELEDYSAALESWRRARDRHPLADPDVKSWIDGRLADACYYAGLPAEAAEHARQVDSDFYRGFAGRLSDNFSPRRVILSVEFVAQHHLTCAPATLSALSRYWKVAVDHDQLAAEICYEGTQDHVERDWAERQGFIAKEFRVTWEAARELIDRGVPFTLTTVETSSAHLQCVIGYDLLRETLILREPSHRVHGEMTVEWLLGRYAPFGPRGMVILPGGEAHRLEGLSLPDEESYDAYYRFQRALEVHDRAAADQELGWLTANDPCHRLTLTARRRLAAYDGDTTAELQAVSQLIELYPKCANFLWGKSLLLGRTAGGLIELPDFLRQLATDSSAEPVFWRDWGRELGKDGRRLREARRYLSLALRVQPCDADNLAEFAGSLWNERQFETATEIYRFAACLPGGGERYGRSYFLAARHVRRTDEALAFLRARFEELGGASVQPARALYFALSVLDRNWEGLALLEEALALRPNDGELLLFTADEFARHGYRDRAGEVLEAARGRASGSAWLRTAAGIAGYQCDLGGALALWRGILEAEPLAADALREVARLLAETGGRASVLEFLEERIARFSHYLPLLELHVEWLKAGAPEKAEPVIRQALAVNPGNAWMKRELASNLAEQRRFDEAIAEAREAVEIEPHVAASHGILGQVLELSGEMAGAAEAYRAAIRLSVDYIWGIRGLFSVSPRFQEKGAAVEFVRRELARQVVFGDSLFAFREEAFSVLNAEALLETLREAHAARQDLWSAWIALVQQLIDMKRLDEALELALKAAEIYPLIPRCWFELALVHRARGEWEQERSAFSGALALNPAWGVVRRGLADSHTRQGDFSQARAVLEQGVAFSPLDAHNRGCLADVLWHLGEKEKALESLQQALRLDPDYQWAWDAFARWSVELGREDGGLELARELTISRAGEARSWLRLAHTLGPLALDEKLAALERAETIEPRNPDIFDVRAVALAAAGRFDEALAACRPPVFGNSPPMTLLGRAAWLQAERGEVATAIENMQRAVRLFPNYYWGWNCLAEWQADQGKLAEALEAARHMERLAPRGIVPLGYIGNLQLQLGQAQEAEATFRKAFELDPGYEYAGRQLFESQLKKREFAEARKTLSIMELHHPGPATEAKLVQWYCASQKKAEALAALRVLCFTPAHGTQALRRATEYFTPAAWRGEPEKVFNEVLEAPGVNPEVGMLWVEAFAAREAWSLQNRLFQLPASSPIGRAARFAFLQAAAGAKKDKAVLSLVSRDGEALREDASCWGQVGYALTTLKRYTRVIEWMQDWRQRTDAQPWMLHNLSLAFRNRGQDREAYEVCLHAVTLREDHTTLDHQVFLAWDEALEGNLLSARHRLKISRLDTLQPYYQVILRLARAMVSVFDAKDKGAEFEVQKLHLQEVASQNVFADPLLQRMGKATVARIAKAAGKWKFSLSGRSVVSQPASQGKIPWAVIWVIIFIAVQALHSCSRM